MVAAVLACLGQIARSKPGKGSGIRASSVVSGRRTADGFQALVDGLHGAESRGAAHAQHSSGSSPSGYVAGGPWQVQRSSNTSGYHEQMHPGLVLASEAVPYWC